MFCNVEDFEDICISSIGGVKALYMLLPDSVASLPRQYCDALIKAADFSLYQGQKFIEMKFQEGTASFIETPNTDSKAGDYYLQSVNCHTSYQKSKLITILQRLQDRRVHLIVIDNNSEVWFVANARLKYKRDTGEATTSRNGVLFQFSAQSRKPIAAVEGFSVEAIPADKVVLVSPNGFKYTIEFNNYFQLVTKIVNYGVDSNIILDEINTGEAYRIRVKDSGVIYTTDEGPSLGQSSISIDNNAIEIIDGKILINGMAVHIQEFHDTEAHILALGSYQPRAIYFTTDTNKMAYGLDNGTLSAWQVPAKSRKYEDFGAVSGTQFNIPTSAYLNPEDVEVLRGGISLSPTPNVDYYIAGITLYFLNPLDSEPLVVRWWE